MEFLEVAAEVAAETIVNKSRFIGILAPAFEEGAALAVLEKARKQYRDASHHCYAYMIGQNRGIMRYSDAGEPQGTAGVPMLEVLKQASLTNVVFVCVRYFGGVLLGAGGLARAYGGCAAETVRQATLLRISLADEYSLKTSYPAWSRMEPFFSRQGVRVLQVSYGDAVEALLSEVEGAGIILKGAAELSNGTALCEYAGKITVKTPVTGNNG